MFFMVHDFCAFHTRFVFFLKSDNTEFDIILSANLSNSKNIFCLKIHLKKQKMSIYVFFNADLKKIEIKKCMFGHNYWSYEMHY